MLEKKTENEGESGSARILTPEREQVELREFWLDGAIPAGHPVRAVWAFVEGLDLTDLYRGIGSVEGGLDDRRRTRGADRPLREAEEGEGGGAEGGRSLEAEEGPGPDGVGRVDQDGGEDGREDLVAVRLGRQPEPWLKWQKKMDDMEEARKPLLALASWLLASLFVAWSVQVALGITERPSSDFGCSRGRQTKRGR